MIYRKAQRNCRCRGCDRLLEKDVDYGIFMFSIRNRGQNIMLCTDCVDKMYEMVQEGQHED